jgi:hypothetical protein
MKIRQGFVSNSSSSSFVVVLSYIDFFDKTQRKYTDANVKRDLLDAHGYTSTYSDDPMKNRPHEAGLICMSVFDDECLVKHIPCNQADEVGFLVQNGIPFHATCHYDTEELFWNGKDDFIIKFFNHGRMWFMYGNDEELDRELREHAGCKVPISRYIS